MNSALKNVFIFAMGAAVGAVATWKFVKTTYEQIAKDEIAEIRDYYSCREKHIQDELDRAHDVLKDNEEKEEIVSADIRDHMAKHEYFDYSNISKNKKEEVEDVNNDPYVIPPEDFGTEDYMQISLEYYEDGVLADEDGDLVEDVEGTVGLESLQRFGEFEDDAVHVRNDRLKAEYEILLIQRKYSDTQKH